MPESKAAIISKEDKETTSAILCTGNEDINKCSVIKLAICVSLQATYSPLAWIRINRLGPTVYTQLEFIDSDLSHILSWEYLRKKIADPFLVDL